MKTYRKALILVFLAAVLAVTAGVFVLATVRSYDEATARQITAAEPSRYHEDEGLILIGEPETSAFVFFPNDWTDPRVLVPLAWELSSLKPSLINPLVLNWAALGRDFTPSIAEKYPASQFILIAHRQGLAGALRMIKAIPDQVQGLILLDCENQEDLSELPLPVLVITTQTKVDLTRLPESTRSLYLPNSTADGFGRYAHPAEGTPDDGTQIRNARELIEQWMRDENLLD